MDIRHGEDGWGESSHLAGILWPSIRWWLWLRIRLLWKRLGATTWRTPGLQFVLLSWMQESSSQQQRKSSSQAPQLMWLPRPWQRSLQCSKEPRANLSSALGRDRISQNSLSFVSRCSAGLFFKLERYTLEVTYHQSGSSIGSEPVGIWPRLRWLQLNLLLSSMPEDLCWTPEVPEGSRSPATPWWAGPPFLPPERHQVSPKSHEQLEVVLQACPPVMACPEAAFASGGSRWATAAPTGNCSGASHASGAGGEDPVLRIWFKRAMPSHYSL